MSFKILFMGTPHFAVPILKSINESSHEIINVYTQPPKKKIVVKKLVFHQFISFQVKLIFQLGVQKHCLIKKNLNILKI